MREAGFDALVLFQPEAFHYVVGAPAGVATMWGRAGSAIALVPVDAGSSLAAVASDHAAPAIRRAAPEVDLRTHRIWIDMIGLDGAYGLVDVNAAYRTEPSVEPRPETFDRAQCYALLADLLAERGLLSARIGVDLEFMPAADFIALQLALPRVAWSDGSVVFKRLRAVKAPAEIERLRKAALAAEAGLVRMAQAIHPGAGLGELSKAWKDGAMDGAKDLGVSLSGHWDFISVGPDLGDLDAKVTPGALIKADVGTLVGGYSSDGARTFSYGPPAPLALDVFRALDDAFAAGLEMLKPGNEFGSVHAAMMASMRRGGFDLYSRGHFGHSVGGGVGIEEWPFFSAHNPELIEPGMVVALEAPFYGQGLGALMIEDQFVITESGADCMISLPRHLRDVAPG